LSSFASTGNTNSFKQSFGLPSQQQIPGLINKENKRGEKSGKNSIYEFGILTFEDIDLSKGIMNAKPTINTQEEEKLNHKVNSKSNSMYKNTLVSECNRSLSQTIIFDQSRLHLNNEKKKPYA
jgi:hypothetical protein